MHLRVRGMSHSWPWEGKNATLLALNPEKFRLTLAFPSTSILRPQFMINLWKRPEKWNRRNLRSHCQKFIAKYGGYYSKILSLQMWPKRGRKQYLRGILFWQTVIANELCNVKGRGGKRAVKRMNKRFRVFVISSILANASLKFILHLHRWFLTSPFEFRAPSYVAASALID